MIASLVVQGARRCSSILHGSQVLCRKPSLAEVQPERRRSAEVKYVNLHAPCESQFRLLAGGRSGAVMVQKRAVCPLHPFQTGAHHFAMRALFFLELAGPAEG